MPRNDFLVFGAPMITDDEIDEVVATMRSGWIGTGPRTREFELRFAEYVGSRYAVGLSSCTAALHLALLVLDVKAGDEVITTPLTWCSTANVIVHAGAKPVFTDVDRNTGCIDPARVEAAITERTRAIIPVHYAGRACDMDALGDIAARHNLKVIGDAAHAIETTWRGRKIGTLDDVTCFSFYPNKNITTGEGGMAATDDEAFAERIAMLRLGGVSADAWKRFRADGPSQVQVVEAGYKCNMTDMQAAMGLRQLDKIEPFHARRMALWDRYNRDLADLPLVLPAPFDPDSRHAGHLYTVLVDEGRAGVGRDALRAELKKRNIGTGVHYPVLHLQQFYRELLAHRPGDFPNAEFIGNRTLSLPLSPAVTDADAEDVVTALREVLD